MNKKVFPSDFSDEELKSKIRYTAETLEVADLNTLIHLAALISVAQGELQTRQAIKIHNAAKKNEKSAAIVGGISVFISLIAIVFAALSWRSSERWETRQLALLEKLHETSTTQAKLSDRILKLEQDKLIQP